MIVSSLSYISLRRRDSGARFPRMNLVASSQWLSNNKFGGRQQVGRWLAIVTGTALLVSGILIFASLWHVDAGV